MTYKNIYHLEFELTLDYQHSIMNEATKVITTTLSELLMISMGRIHIFNKISLQTISTSKIPVGVYKAYIPVSKHKIKLFIQQFVHLIEETDKLKNALQQKWKYIKTDVNIGIKRIVSSKIQQNDA